MSSLPRLLYTSLLMLLAPLAKKRLAREKVNELSDSQRAGHISPCQQPVIWAHCASVGEVLAAEPLLKQLQQRHPNKQLVVTTMTATGAMQVRQRFPDARHYLLPLDLPWNTTRFIRTLKPLVGIIFETELWPNLIHSCKQAGIPLMLANGRLSAKAFTAYKKIRPLIAEALQSITLVAAKAPVDAERFIELGFPASRLQITGSIKYDLQPPSDLPQQAASLRAEWQRKCVWIAASTHEGEDLPLLQAHQQLLKDDPDALLLLVPRHPQRFDQVAELIQQQSMNMARRSQQQPVTSATQVYLCDTLGEMLLFYAAADLAFVAGSLQPIGGHNLLEPAALGVPMITGPHLDNFAEIAELLREVGGMKEIQQASELAPLLLTLLKDPLSRENMTSAAYKVVESNRGALAKQLELAESLFV